MGDCGADGEPLLLEGRNILEWEKWQDLLDLAELTRICKDEIRSRGRPVAAASTSCVSRVWLCFRVEISGMVPRDWRKAIIRANSTLCRTCKNYCRNLRESCSRVRGESVDCGSVVEVC